MAVGPRTAHDQGQQLTGRGVKHPTPGLTAGSRAAPPCPSPAGCQLRVSGKHRITEAGWKAGPRGYSALLLSLGGHRRHLAENGGHLTPAEIQQFVLVGPTSGQSSLKPPAGHSLPRGCIPRRSPAQNASRGPSQHEGRTWQRGLGSNSPWPPSSLQL